mgnify:CR=1 FL=1
MGFNSGPYDSDFIQPVARVKENLSIWTLGQWAHYQIEDQNPIPPGPASTVEMVALTVPAITSIGANATIAKQLVAVLQLNDLEFTHLRWEPLDAGIEGLIWEVAGQQKFASRAIHARVDSNTRQWDRHLSTTTFWVLGLNRDMNLEVRNRTAFAQPIARFIFMGYRMLLKAYDLSALTTNEKRAMTRGDKEVVAKIIGPTTWVQAEGRQA